MSKNSMKELYLKKKKFPEEGKILQDRDAPIIIPQRTENQEFNRGHPRKELILSSF